MTTTTKKPAAKRPAAQLSKGARKLPPTHLSIRVPWHDSGWDGTVCRDPKANTSCNALARIGESKRDDEEVKSAGKSLNVLNAHELPPCIGERAAFMSKTPLVRITEHPYASFEEQYKHFKKTQFVHEPFSAACVPFRWMLLAQAVGEIDDTVGGICDALQLDYQHEREPVLKRKTSWVQQADNQLVMLDTFFGAIEPEKSLCFFYAKRTPLSESTQRVLIGVGRVTQVGPHVEYEYEPSKLKDRLRSVLWERNVFHSIREDCSDGFLFPYDKLLALAKDDPTLNVDDYVAFVPDELREQFSYGTEHVSDDGAITALVACADRLRKLAVIVPGPWEICIKWLDRELERLWKARGPFPGIGAALCAFGLEHGNLIGYAISAKHTAERDDPWKLVDAVFRDPKILGDLGKNIGATFQKKWKALAAPRRKLLELLSRCALTSEQATRYWEQSTREESGISLTDAQLLENLYRAYEEDRNRVDAVSFGVIDRGLFPPAAVAKDFPLQAPSALADAIDPRRVRALTIDTLEQAAIDGHTLLPLTEVVKKIRDRPLEPSCPLDNDTLAVTEEFFAPLVETIAMENKMRGFQLSRFVQTRAVIAKSIEKRQAGKRHIGSHDWATLLGRVLAPVAPDSPRFETEKKARIEKVAALEEIFASRVSVLIGPAGTGKTTLLRVLCDLPEVRDGGVLLLAPTGKARVRLESQTKLVGKGKTIAQFLLGLERYDGETGRYFVNPTAPRCGTFATVIVDESSMLTEEQLAALMDGLEKVDRLVLVGDQRQLPPIGAGRPFVDIVTRLTPTHVEGELPRVARGYAELRVPCRHDADRDDVQLAAAFGGKALDAAHDEVWGRILAGKATGVSFIRWSDASEVIDKLAEALLNRLPTDHDDPETRFECSLGGTISGAGVYFWAGRDGQPGAAAKSAEWQVLSPLRGALAGTDALNRAIQQRFRQKAIKKASPEKFYYATIPAPLGPHRIIWGDKVINTQNKSRRRTYPRKDDSYVANGDSGMVVGEYKTKTFPGIPKNLEVEFVGQDAYKFTYWKNEFSGQNSDPPLELAYALTVHKTQGSEFGTTYVVLPNPCRVLSRELLYTALTRHKNELVVLHQGELADIFAYSNESYSAISTRMTNLFCAPKLVEVIVDKKAKFFEEKLIHRSISGVFVRSKSELCIADTLYRAGKRFAYEASVQLKNGVRSPDFTVRDDDSGVTYYWEHLGMLNDPAYRVKWAQKLKDYRASGILPFSEGGGPNGTLIISSDDEKGGLDTREIDRIVREDLP